MSRSMVRQGSPSFPNDGLELKQSLAERLLLFQFGHAIFDEVVNYDLDNTVESGYHS